MSVTILEALQNANYNLDNCMKGLPLLPLVKEQLYNATELLDKGYPLHTEVEPLLEEHGGVDSVPDMDGQWTTIRTEEYHSLRNLEKDIFNGVYVKSNQDAPL